MGVMVREIEAMSKSGVPARICLQEVIEYTGAPATQGVGKSRRILDFGFSNRVPRDALKAIYTR
jgi:hypothetical protein